MRYFHQPIVSLYLFYSIFHVDSEYDHEIYYFEIFDFFKNLSTPCGWRDLNNKKQRNKNKRRRRRNKKWRLTRYKIMKVTATEKSNIR